MVTYCNIERVAAHDLVEMRRVERAWVDDGVGPLDDELRAAEAEEIRPLCASKLRRDILHKERGEDGQDSFGPSHVRGFSSLKAAKQWRAGDYCEEE